MFNDSEKFRSNLYLASGYTFCSPLWLYMLGLILENQNFNPVNFSISIILVILGILLISHAYYIFFGKRIFRMENISLPGQLLIFSSILILPIMLFIFLGKSYEDRYKEFQELNN